MSNKKGPFTWLKEELFSDSPPGKINKKYRYMLVVLLFGIVIMLISNLFFEQADQEPKTDDSAADNEPASDLEVFRQKGKKEEGKIAAYEQAYENQLKEALENIAGVSDVTVIVNVDATDKKILEKNVVTQSQITDETDREGGKRIVEDQSTDEQVVIVRHGDEEVPIILETKKPEIRGVLVVANGAENIHVKKWIIESVTRVLDVPSHRVAVMPKKRKGE